MMTEADQNLENGMEDLSDDKTAVWPSPGEKLRKIREERGLSHHRVADALHMTAHYVKSLESDQYDKLPGKTFVKGYFKAYARLLEADVDEIMRCYENFVVALEESQESVAEEIRARKVYDQNIRWMICAAVIIIVVVGVSWWMSRQPQNTAEVDENRTTSTAVVEVQSITEPENTSANTQVSENVLGFADVQEPVTAEALIAKLEEKPGEKAGLQNLAEPEELQNIEKELLPSCLKNPLVLCCQSQGAMLLKKFQKIRCRRALQQLKPVSVRLLIQLNPNHLRQFRRTIQSPVSMTTGKLM